MSAPFKNSKSDRLLHLSGEVSRIANALAQLSTSADADKRRSEETPVSISLECVNSVIRRRRQRANHFPRELFADPAWDILLDLLQAELMERRTSVSSVCLAACVPATTALRWLKNLEEQGFVVRRADPLDRRRVFVELAPSASSAIRRWFADGFAEAA